MTLAIQSEKSLVKPMLFVDLHAHTTLSTGDGYGLPKEHIARLAELGRTHACFTEHGNVSSWVALEKEALAKGLEPIFGIEAYVGKEGERRKTHMILLAMNEIGLQNINRIVTQSYKQFYQWPTVYMRDLKRWNEGVIALSGCADSALSCTLLGGKYFGEKKLVPSKGDLQRAVAGIQWFQDVFGDRYYIEVQRFPGLDRTCALNPIFAKLSRYTGAQLVSTSDTHYPYPNQNALQRILHASHRGGTIETADADWEYDILLTYPESDKEIFRDMKDTGLTREEAIASVENTATIARRCEGVRLPRMTAPKYIQGTGDWDNWQ